MAKIPINLSTGTVEKNEELIVGIDLGTTNSLVAYINNGNATAVRDEDGKQTLVPSVIHFADDGILVGDLAKSKLIAKPEKTIYSVKRLMGKSYTDVNSFENYLSYRIIDEDENALVKIEVDGKYYSPIELSSEILKALKARIERRLEQEVHKAVITVPAYFNDTQRQATRDAGKLAGLDVLRIINEPTAASLAYGIGVDPNEEKTVVVYDLGGGTFDVSILQIQQGIFEVLSTNGDTFDDKSFKQEVRLQAEEAKKQLSSKEEYKNGDYHISLGQFNSLVEPLIAATIESCEQALKDAELKKADISNIIMVGGSTRVPLVKSSISKFFEKEVDDNLNPDEVVALGAAIQGDILAGNQKGMLLLDVTPLSLGIETVGGLMDAIIPRNNKVPAKVGRNYTTSVDGQTKLKVSVFQGERDMVEDNRKLGEFILSGIPPMPAGIPKIEIQFILDADGILVVKASELRSGIAQKIEIRSQYGLSEEEMGKMLLESFQHAEKDLASRALLEARNVFSKEQIEQLISMTQELDTVTKAEDKDAINKAMEVLNEYSRPLAEIALDHAINNALKGKEL